MVDGEKDCLAADEAGASSLFFWYHRRGLAPRCMLQTQHFPLGLPVFLCYVSERESRRARACQRPGKRLNN